MKRILFSLLLAFSLLAFQSCDEGEQETPAIAIGDFYQGGVVFYLDATREHGLTCAVSDQSFAAPWACTPLVVDGADGIALGTGAQNTIDIVNACSSTSSEFAADLCDKLELNKFDDWFLPSKDELDLLYQNREKVNETAKANGGAQLEDTEYWTSSHKTSNTVWIQNFSAGNQSGGFEDKLFNVRAIRAF